MTAAPVSLASPATSAIPAPIRLATVADAEAMRAVYAPYVATPVTFDADVPTAREFAARLADVMPAFPCCVLELDRRIAGFAYAHAQAERAAYRWNAELSVYLEPDATGRGAGRALYSLLLGLLRHQGFKSAYALVTVPNAASERLHESLGFARSWVQPRAGWKEGAWHDVAWFVKYLAPFEGNGATPADPMPFDAFAAAHPDLVQRALDRANATLTGAGASADTVR